MPVQNRRSLLFVELLYTVDISINYYFLNRVGSDEEDNDSDQEENKDSELETAVSREDSNVNKNEITSSTELNSNGHEYVLVNRSTSNETVPEHEEKKNENEEVANS